MHTPFARAWFACLVCWLPPQPVLSRAIDAIPIADWSESTLFRTREALFASFGVDGLHRAGVHTEAEADRAAERVRPLAEDAVGWWLWAGPVLADELGVGGAQRHADRERDDQRIVEAADDRDEIGDQVEWQIGVAGERAQRELVVGQDAGIVDQAAAEDVDLGGVLGETGFHGDWITWDLGSLGC